MLPSTAFLVGLFLGLAMGGFLAWAFLSLRPSVEKPQQLTRSDNLEPSEFATYWHGGE
jgi:hypothetical protein